MTQRFRITNVKMKAWWLLGSNRHLYNLFGGTATTNHPILASSVDNTNNVGGFLLGKSTTSRQLFEALCHPTTTTLTNVSYLVPRGCSVPYYDGAILVI